MLTTFLLICIYIEYKVCMWGSLILEIFYTNSFNLSFPLTSNDMILNLTFWQYWWWFWFMYFFVLYYFLVLRLIRFRFFKFSPKLVTSYRAHGKWGDLIICVIPISWCLNIISNSNLLLKILEWQGETGLLTIRIRGKQWYWVYKFELKSFNDIINTTKSIGFNKLILKNWFNSTNTSLYLLFLNKRSNYNILKNHWTQYFYNTAYSLNYCLSNSYNMTSTSFYILQVNKQNGSIPLTYYANLFNHLSKIIPVTNSKFNYLDMYFKKNILTQHYFTFIAWNFIFKKKIFFFKNLTNSINENSRSIKKFTYYNLPTGTNCLNLNSLSQIWNIVFDSTTLQKIYKNNILLQFLVIKQKRYIPKKIKINDTDNHLVIFKYNYFNVLNVNNLYIINYLFNKFNNNKNLVTFNLNKRLLKTKRILILPGHMNISIITNSFDVVHSWYIPGLGIKLDCVPGRSTHHNIYINNYGFYYGQCAEICGRYHHHMPIRVCSLPFEHFIIWWYNYSLNIYLNFTKNRLFFNTYSLRYYTW
jgi:heme/copper-type cytochrome/quinol oxidase subunit 2